jgi:hypothetical protein
MAPPMQDSSMAVMIDPQPISYSISYSIALLSDNALCLNPVVCATLWNCPPNCHIEVHA